MNFSIFSKNKSCCGSRGFTLAELLVVISIVTAIITALVIQQNRWNDQIVVRTQTYELALMLRQAQVYSLGVRQDTVSGSFDVGYGVYFDTDKTRYIYFVDRNTDQKFSSGEGFETKTLARGVTIKDVCGNSRCIHSGGGSARQASIAFFRPETKAYLKLLNNGGQPADSPQDTTVLTVTLESPGGKTSLVRIRNNGQISIE